MIFAPGLDPMVWWINQFTVLLIVSNASTWVVIISFPGCREEDRQIWQGCVEAKI